MRNEAQTRFDLIDHCGWRRQDIRVEQTDPQIDIIAGKGYRRPSGRTVYLLCRPLAEDGESIPIAIVEAKKESLPAEQGLQQATPEIKQIRGLAALREGGEPSDLMRKTKETLFVA